MEISNSEDTYSVPEPKPAMHLGSTSTVFPGAPDTVPYSVYASLLRECHSLEGQTQTLSYRIDSMFDSTPTSSSASHLADRLRSLIRMGQQQLDTLPPVGSAKTTHVRMFVQMLVDELQRVVDEMEADEFKGTLDLVEAQSWLKEIEKAFALVTVGENQKTGYASYFLKGEANYWWESVRALEATEVIPWERFKKLFLDQYFPKYMQTQMELRFFELKQNELSVSEYEKKFTELSRFVPEYVDTEEKKGKRFQQGLKSWIRSRVAMFQYTTYAEVLQLAKIVEGESEQNQKEKNKKRKFGFPEEGSSQGKPVNRFVKKPGFQTTGKGRNFQKNETGNRNHGNKPSGQNQQRPSQLPIPECKSCLKKHTGTCNKVDIVCYKCQTKGHYANECGGTKQNVTGYRCGKVRHISKECKTPVKNNNLMRLTAAPIPSDPNPMNQVPIYPAPVLQVPNQQMLPYPTPTCSTPARTFNKNMKDAIQSSDVVAGTLLVNAVTAKVLIDSGATRSFISRDFVAKLGCEVRKLHEAISIMLANQDRVLADQICPQCVIEISGCHFPISLIPFQLGEFDVILGMDWLAENSVQIDCKGKKVILKSPEGRKITWKGQK
ncbi:hypothetical protein POM88_013872 [Heracleum sosnowskyi]|uniref:CCHC-type domain-containing protein n=1 Tax=Heracleum sosnowskyi TaxID=360622 RepID=A0AAD8N3R5_9APIA|nr:hypothetical protein POM88_013872 [Heracleum sosnowskyi]